MNKVFIDGEAGTTGLQIRERLAARRDVTLISIDADRRKDAGERQRLLNEADVAILCLPDEASREAVSLIENGTTRVIDASTAYRVADGWTYGFAEMSKSQSEEIAKARFVANPGCWPQGLIALLRPLVEAGLFPAELPVTYHGISGYTGGGRKMVEEYEAASDPIPYLPYGLGFKHKHLPEMTRYSGLRDKPHFQPIVGNFAQGMLTFVPLHLSALPNGGKLADIHAAIADYFAGQQFVTVAPLEATERTEALDPRALNGTNSMRLYVFGNEASGQATLAAQYDNLGKGASGAAVQNLNLMLGLAPNSGLVAV